MAITPPYIKLSNGDIITFERLGPTRTAVLSNSEGVLIRKGNKLIGSTEKEQANTIILGFPYPNPTIVEEVLTPIPPPPPPVTTPPPPPTPPPPVTTTPEKVEEKRLQKSDDLKKQGIDITTIKNSIPNDLKKQGIEKLSVLLISKGEEIRQQVIPKITEEINKAKSSADYCNSIKALLATRNNIVSKLNNISTFLDQTTLAFTGLSVFFELIILAKSAISNATTAAYVAAGFFPTIPGSVITGINSLNIAKEKITTSDLGESKLITLRNILGGSAISLAVLSASIRTAILLLNSLDTLLSKCDTNISNSLISVSPSLIAIAEQVEKSDQVNNDLYKGFLIKIETVPYTSTVNRYKAVGINSDGIKIIETGLSFTQNTQTLIDELKQNIDNNNLKAN